MLSVDKPIFWIIPCHRRVEEARAESHQRRGDRACIRRSFLERSDAYTLRLLWYIEDGSLVWEYHFDPGDTPIHSIIISYHFSIVD